MKIALKTIAFALLFFVLCFSASVMLEGCKTNNPQSTITTAYKSEAAADDAVTASMIAWGEYVAQFHPPVSQEFQVKRAFMAYQRANLAVIDATTAYANATGTNSVAAAANLDAAKAQAATSLGNVIGLVAQLTIQTNQPIKSPKTP